MNETNALRDIDLLRLKALLLRMTQDYTPPNIHPDRLALKLRPLKAWKHMQNLLADKEDTEQVFHIIEALNGNALKRDLQRLSQSVQGQKLMADRYSIPELLDNHTYLKTLPDGSVGRAYQAFMEREGLSAAGLIAETEKFFDGKPRYNDDLDWYADVRRDTHDMLHIMSGYGRDALGEACVLNFTVGQHKGFGAKFIAVMAGRRINKHAPAAAPIYAALKQASRNGKIAGKVAREDFRELVKENLEQARARLGINPPTLYKACMDTYAELGKTPSTVAMA